MGSESTSKRGAVAKISWGESAGGFPRWPLRSMTHEVRYILPLSQEDLGMLRVKAPNCKPQR